ncbi:MAG: ATP-binding protein [Terracidiphilus sp.]
MFSPAVKAPAAPSSPEQVADALENIVALHGLPFEDRMWLAAHGREACVNAGEVLFEEGATADHMVLILKGEIHVRRQHGGPISLFIGRTGQMTGILPFSRMKSYGGQGFAVSPVWALLVARTDFPAMLDAIPSMAQRVVSTLLDRVREVTRIEQQAEKLMALGKLAGNLAHELNNPASAAQRAAATVVEAVQANRRNRFKLINLCLSQEQVNAIEAWESKVLNRPLAMPGIDEEPGAVDYLKREETIRAWLTQKDCAEPWEIAPELAEQGITVADLEELNTTIGADEICISLQFFARFLRSSHAADTLVISTARIFDLIDAVKDYSNMDRAPILQVDVPAGLDATLQMFQSRMEHVKVERDYEKGLPRISAYSGELNQVWTALIENALDALGAGAPADRSSSGEWRDQGTLRVTCRMEVDLLLVEIWDTGPGIPPDLQERIFEPFFTTKAPGRGLGLGLDYAMRIVRKHRGHLSVKSEPGSTCFRVRLPLDQLQAY